MPIAQPFATRFKTMYGVERKAEIIGIIEERGTVDVALLAERFGASKETIRRDLRELEKDGVVCRTHGGAVRKEGAKTPEYPVSVRKVQRYAEKNAICRRAAQMIEDGDIIFVDNSSTSVYLARYIDPSKQVTILTNSIGLLLESVEYACENHTYICLGGIFKSGNLSLYGAATQRSAAEYLPGKAFVSCEGLQGGVFADASVHEVETKRLMIQRSRVVTVLCDHTKFTHSGQIVLCGYDEVDYLVTDKATCEQDAEMLKDAGVCVLPACVNTGDEMNG